MEIQTKKCPCGEVVEYESSCSGCTNLGELIENTGWTPILGHDMSTVYLCPECFEKASKLAHQIMDIVGNENLYFPNLLG